MKAVLSVCGLLFVTIPALAQVPANWMLELTLDGQRVEGTPVAWNAEVVHLLGRDGRLWEFAPSQAADYRKTADRFESYTVSQLRAMLLRELGEGFEVTGTGHYLVAHPRGHGHRWAQRFEDLYRAFRHYFSARGLRLQEPAFPLIGVVCRDQQEFLRYSTRQGCPASPRLLGYYSLQSNRIMLYDRAGDRADWRSNGAVVIHEATHQTAFNCGIHSRFAQPPVWVAEGLATLFEAPGVYDSYHFTQRRDRINRGWFRQFQQAIPQHRPELLADLVASDRIFQTAPALAYAEAWAFTFYLTETQAQRYVEYLVRTAQRPPFVSYSASERVADFAAVFGSDWRMLEARFLRFMKELD